MAHCKGRQGRFLLATVGGWIAARAWLLWPAAPAALGGALVSAALLDQGDVPVPRPAPAPPFRPIAPPPGRPPAPPSPTPVAIVPFTRLSPSRAGHLLLGTFDGGYGTETGRLLRYATYAPPADAAPTPPPAAPLPAPSAPPPAGTRAIEAQAYLFLRPGSGRAALAPGGSLGGSQVAARLAVPLGDTPVAAAARIYAPRHAAGAQAAVGLDWHPLPGVPLRLSVERRMELDAAGRDAWSAYAAGGFYRALPGRLEIDGYAQAGVVGARSRDLFADGALRLGRDTELAGVTLVAGGGVWGAAQPGAARLDAGPRLALRLPLAGHRITAAAEGRFRLAGHASPGSGAALTLAIDY